MCDVMTYKCAHDKRKGVLCSNDRNTCVYIYIYMNVKDSNGNGISKISV